MPATSWRSSPPPRSTRSTSSRSAFGCGSAARTVPTLSSTVRNCANVTGGPCAARSLCSLRCSDAPGPRAARGACPRAAPSSSALMIAPPRVRPSPRAPAPRSGRAHPAPDDEGDAEPAHQDGGEGRHPREPVEAAEGRRGKHLLAVAGAEGGEDRLPVLAAREAFGDLLLHRLARRALEVVAGVDGEPAAALAGE